MASESPLNDTKQAADTTKGAVQATKGAKTAIQATSTIIKGGTGPAGWMMLAKQFAPQIKKLTAQMRKAAAAGAALLAYLIYLLGLKLAGLIAGLGFGAVTGLPLLIVPGAGPFLYAGWVSYWGYKGFTDPLSTIHLATHPWEPLTNAFNSAKNFFGRAFNATGVETGNVTTTISSGVSGGASYAGNFITSTIASGWNLGIGGLGNALGGALNIGSRFFGMFAGASGAEAATLSQVAVGGAIGTVATATVVAGIMTNAAFFTPEGDEGITPPGQNTEFTIAKTAAPQSIGSPGQDVTFTISLTAKSQPITDVGFIDNFRFQKDGTETSLTASVPTFTCTFPITVGSTCTNQFKFNTFLIPTDSLLINTVLASVTLADGANKIDSATVSVPIGAPASNCPQGWPSTGRVTQGPEGATSHGNPAYGAGYEAIDIGEAVGQPVYATVDGTIDDQGEVNTLDKRMGIQPAGCPGLYIVNFWHMSAKYFTDGQTVKRGQQIGEVGAYMLDGVPQPHTHYQFNATGDRSFRIEPPYIPTTVPRTCNGVSSCNITISSAP